VHVNTTLASRE